MTDKPPARPLLSEPEEVALLKDIAESLNEANDITAAMSAILPRLSHVLGLRTAWAFRFDPARATFVEVGASGLPPALSRNNGEALKSSWCECQDRMVNGRLDTAVNIVRCSRLRDAPGDKEGLKFHASIPMKMNGQPLGILNVAADGATVFTQPALDLLRAIGFHVAVTMDRAALIADMKRRNEQLQSLGLIARELTGTNEQSELFSRAVSLFATRMGYEGVALFDGENMIHRATMASHSDLEYSYRDRDSALLPPPDRKILADTCSALSIPVPHFPLAIRIESRSVGAFGPIDEEILTAFAWYLTALLEQIAYYHQALDTARWAERRQLAADLHDSVSQHLFSAQLITRALRQRSGNSAAASADELAGRLEAVVRTSQEEMRRLIETLRPDSAPLAAELQHRLIRLRDSVGLEVTWDIADAELSLSARVRDAVLRITDEALQNAIKHAPSSSIHVSLRLEGHHPVLKIWDNGPGFDPVSVRGGFGLTTMRERAQAARLSFQLMAAPGQGTSICLGIPTEDETHG